MDSIKVADGQVVKLPFQHRLAKMVLANLAGFLVSELIGNSYERYQLARINKAIESQTKSES